MGVKKEHIEEFCQDFQYPVIILYGLEEAFLGIAELFNGHKILLYDKEMIYCCFSKQGYPIDIIEEKFDKFFDFWKELASTPGGVFSGQPEETIKKHLPALVTRFKEGVNPILENISYRERPDLQKRNLKLKEMLEEDERFSKQVFSDTREELQSIRESFSD